MPIHIIFPCIASYILWWLIIRIASLLCMTYIGWGAVWTHSITLSASLASNAQLPYTVIVNIHSNIMMSHGSHISETIGLYIWYKSGWLWTIVSFEASRMLRNMKKIALLVAILALISGALAALPCNSRLRLIRPNLFKHCENNCNGSYGQWSSWKTISKGVHDECDSKKAYNQTRFRNSLTKNCPRENETRYYCKYHASM